MTIQERLKAVSRLEKLPIPDYRTSPSQSKTNEKSPETTGSQKSKDSEISATPQNQVNEHIVISIIG